MRLGIAWGGQVQDALAEHFRSLAEFPPCQKGEESQGREPMNPVRSAVVLA